MLSDVNKEVIKALKVGSGMMGLAAVARVTYVIDKKGIVKQVLYLIRIVLSADFYFAEIPLMRR